jgi:hypothetical protein
MEGNQPPSLRAGRFAAVLALCFVTFAGRASAQQQPPPLPPSGMPARSYAGFLDAVSPQQTIAGPMTVAQPSYYPDPCGAPTACRAEMSLLDTIRESLCGDASAEGKWRPLTLGTFFSEGWREPWAGGPAGQSGLTPRHGWLGAFEGVFYRLWLVNGTYQHNLNKPFGGDAYGSNFTTFLPFSRRFELFFNAPFIAANGTEDPTRGYRTDFGDLQVAGSFLLSETAACTQLFTVGATLPTGQSETGGHLTAVNPRYSFWSNPGGAWVVRGGTGVNIPLNDSSGQTTFNGDVAVGRYFRPHDVPFGDLVFYVNSNVFVPLEGGGRTTVGVGPGTRFQITGNWYFLNYLEVQVAGEKPFDYQVQAAIVKAW